MSNRPQTEQEAATVFTQKIYAMVTAGLLAVGLIVLSMVLLQRPKNNVKSRYTVAPRQVVHGTRDGAATMSKHFVIEKLKAPAGAIFPTINKMDVESLGVDNFKVSSYVDSENAVGAVIRSDYVVRLHYVPNEDMWHLDSIEIESR